MNRTRWLIVLLGIVVPIVSFTAGRIDKIIGWTFLDDALLASVFLSVSLLSAAWNLLKTAS